MKVFLMVLAALAALVLLHFALSFVFSLINSRHNSHVTEPDGFINDQSTKRGSVKDLKYGFFSMGFNGCELIAVHNAILAEKGKSVPIGQIAKTVQRAGGMALLGLFGTAPRTVGRALRKYGVTAEKIKRTEMTRDGTYVVSYFVNPPISAIHTVAVTRRNGRFTAYNNGGPFDPEKCKGFITGYYLEKQ